jgi:hypothetical protein
MILLGRIMSLVILGVLLQFAAGPGARANVSQQDQTVAVCSGQEMGVAYQSADHVQGGIGQYATSTKDCDNGSCSGLTCSCAHHGMSSAIFSLSFALPEVLIADVSQTPPRGFTQIGAPPPVRPPKI